METTENNDELLAEVIELNLSKMHKPDIAHTVSEQRHNGKHPEKQNIRSTTMDDYVCPRYGSFLLGEEFTRMWFRLANKGVDKFVVSQGLDRSRRQKNVIFMIS